MGATELTEERPGKEAEGPPDDCTLNVDKDAAVAAKASRCVYINAMPAISYKITISWISLLFCSKPISSSSPLSTSLSLLRVSAAFHEAAKAGDNAALSTLLLAFNSSTDARSSLLIDARDPRTGQTALHVACKTGAPVTVKWLLEKGASVLITDKYVQGKPWID